MQIGAITGYIDVAQIVLYGFWIFFAGLILYLRREDKREGYPLETESRRRGKVQGFPSMPKPKIFRLRTGQIVTAPRAQAEPEVVAARPVGNWPGAPLRPTGNPMQDGVGPAAYALRADVPDLTLENEPKLVPLRRAIGYGVSPKDPDPRGMSVVDARYVSVGTVTDLWVDRTDALFRYYEVELKAAPGAPILVPVTLSKVIARRRIVRVKSLMAAQFALAPRLRNPEQVTFLEEDRISAYFASGHLYATPARIGPYL
ncbi:MAG: photosynthetic reaction center subunit H [Burkholderiaceae bacterium]|jgi:photosynthetic reaction center H subunit